MPARNYRITLTNRTDLALSLKQKHLCHGDWTPGGWEPPGTIASHEFGQWQSESGGAFTGTEGWLKYKLLDPVNPEDSEQVYVHWQVPYAGTPVFPGVDGSSAQVSLGDVVPHCDVDSSGGGSGFTGTPKHQLVLTHASTSPDDPTIGDILAAYSNPVSVLASFIGGLESHLYVWLELQEVKSARQAIPLRYDPSNGLLALARQARAQSVRKLLRK